MNEAGDRTGQSFRLPTNVVTKLDLAQLISDAERADNELTTIEVHTEVGAPTEQPIFSDRLTAFLAQNNMQFQDSGARTELLRRLRSLKDDVPTLHATFSVEVERDQLHELVQWLRESIHPHIVVEVGLQPSLIAGVYLRTPNKILDLSLRAAFKNRRGVLLEKLEALGGRN